MLSFDVKTSFTINLRHVSTNKILLWTEQMDLDSVCNILTIERPANPVTTLWTVCHGSLYIPSRPVIDRPCIERPANPVTTLWTVWAMGPVIYLVGLGWIGPVERPANPVTTPWTVCQGPLYISIVGLSLIGPIERPANPVTTLWTWTVCHVPCYIPSRPGIDRP